MRIILYGGIEFFSTLSLFLPIVGQQPCESEFNSNSRLRNA